MANFITISSVLKKIIIAVTGISLFLFLIVHLLGNITIFTGSPPGRDFNAYAHFLESFGILFTIAELGLLGFFGLHITTSLYTNFINYKSRKSRYAVSNFAGGKSKKTYASTSMVITGVVVMAFLIWHVLQFRFGPYYETIYLSVNGGEPVRDLYRLITEEFSNDTFENEFVSNNTKDELYEEAVKLVIREQKASTSFIQRYFRIGYNRAATIIEKMEENNIVSKPGRAGKRDIILKDK